MAQSLEQWRTDFDLDTVNAMADELVRQAAHITAAEYRWLRLLAEFDALGGWATGGAKSCAAWLSFACGLSPVAAREHVRVARALVELPLVCEAFGNGSISYSKVRAITRVATPENEELLVVYAQSSTAAQLEKVVRGYRRCNRLEESQEATKVFERRWVRHWVDEDGCVRVSACLPPDEGALFVAEMERLAESGGEEQAAPPAPEAQPVSAETAEAGRGDAPVVSHRLDAAPPIEARRADALRMMAETCAATGPVAAVRGDTHLVVLTVSLDELRDSAFDAAAAVAAQPQDADAHSAASIEGIGRVSAETARRLACDATVAALVEDALGRPLGVGRQSQKVPRWLRRALNRRDGGGCRFPGCNAQRFVDAHHIVHWADEGPTDLDNLVLLCRFHHRLVHEVGYQILVRGPGTFTFLRPDGSPVTEQPRVFAGDPRRPERDNEERGIGIAALTGIPDWDGKPPDYSYAVEVLSLVSAGTARVAG